MVPFLLSIDKRNELGRASGRKRLISLLRALKTESPGCWPTRYRKKKGQYKASTRLSASGSLFFVGPRTQCERRSRPEGRASKMRVKKSKQKKGPPRRSSPGHSFVPGFSDSPSWLGRKTPPIHGRRPTGLPTMQACHLSARATATSTSTSTSTAGSPAPPGDASQQPPGGGLNNCRPPCERGDPAASSL